METVDIHALLREYESAIDNREEDERNQGTRGRATKAAAELVRAVEGLHQSERYAWKNTRLLDGERMRYRDALERIRAFPVGEFRPLKDECEIWRIANEALGSAASAEPKL